MTRSPVTTGLLLLIFIGALAIRLARLDERPMHVDESVQAVKTDTLYDTGVYTYDPHEHHGPTLYYFAAAVMKLSGCDNSTASKEFHYRVVPVIFGAGLILLLLLFRDAIGSTATVFAALFVAISPAMVFYSRYFIQEMLLVFFTLALIGSMWRYFCNPSLGWAVACGVLIGLMHATKETCVIAFFSIAVGVLAAVLLPRSRENSAIDWRPHINVRHGLILIGSAVIVSVLWFTSFFTNARGPLDSILTYMNYLHRAGGEGSSGIHDHPWNYYLMTLLYAKEGRGPLFSEALVVALAAIGCIAGISGRGISSGHAGFIRALSIGTLVMTAVYSIISYKTPWCLLSFYIGMILLAGIGASVLIESFKLLPLKIASAAVVIALAAQLGWQSYVANFKFYDDPRNPYVYAHTVSDFLRLVKRVEEVAAVSPDKESTLIKVCSSDYWPLPWYLRRFKRIGYWNSPPENADAPIIVTSPAMEDSLSPKLKREYQKEFYGLRPKVFLKLYIDKELWDRYMNSRSAPKQNQ